ncbi:MAG: hypothetical protein JWM36_1956 [Hyphomicrobiales bacterium]|nr:hypothetical protein [Hyphomicrobiales bacterium]
MNRVTPEMFHATLGDFFVPAPLSPPISEMVVPMRPREHQEAGVLNENMGIPGLVSVLIPSYNHAPYISDCLSSIVDDGYASLEVILIDDGSCDGTYEVAAQWREDHPSAFGSFRLCRQDNEGLNRTLNKLIGMARGQYICLLASDDMLSPGGISARVAALREHPQWLAVFGDCDVIDRDGHQTHASGFTDLAGADKVALADPRRIETELIWRWSVPGPVLLVDRRMYFAPGGYGLYPEDRIVEDRDFYLSALARKQIGFIDAKVASYRLHGANVSRVLGPMVEKQNRDAERLIARELHGLSKAGLMFKLFVYGVQSRANASGTPVAIFMKRCVRKMDHLLTRCVLARNSRLARGS